MIASRSGPEDRRTDRRRLTSVKPKGRYRITPDPMRHPLTSVLPKRMVDKIIARRLGLTPPA
jgi:hypothetical protein